MTTITTLRPTTMLQLGGREWAVVRTMPHSLTTDLVLADGQTLSVSNEELAVAMAGAL